MIYLATYVTITQEYRFYFYFLFLAVIFSCKDTISLHIFSPFRPIKVLIEPNSWSKWTKNMLKNSSKNQQLNLFHSPLSDMLDMSDPLIALADTIDWQIFEDAFAKYYSDEGRPAKPIRLIVGILLLKQLENLSDD